MVNTRKSSGYILPTVIVFSVVLLGIGLLLLQSIAALTSSVQSNIDRTKQSGIAEAGLAHALHCINTTNKAPTFTLFASNNCDNSGNGGPNGVFDEYSRYTTQTSEVSNKITLSSQSSYDSKYRLKVEIPKTTLTIDPSASQTMTAIGSGKNFSSVSVGAHYACGVSSGKAYCWGNNWFGNIGDGTTTHRSRPVAVDASGVLASKTVTQISTGATHTCAIADGDLYCWGSGSYGNLGRGSTANSSVPVAVDTSGVLAGKTVTQVSVGNFYSCALADGEAYCWGYNGGGQLGDGSTSNRTRPVAVDTSGVLAGKTVSHISAGWGSSACAVADAEAYCWGNNDNGRLGNGTTTDSRRPVAVDTSGALAGKSATQVAVLSESACLLADNSVFCWGRNNYGQLGNGTTTDSRRPVAVDTSGALAGKSATQISTGSLYACAVADGDPYCWGYNEQGQFGNGNTSNHTYPVAVDTSGVLPAGATSNISANVSTCVLASGDVYCWGYNGYRAIGDGTQIDRLSPVTPDTSAVPNSPTTYTIPTGQTHSAGGYHNCEVSGGKVYCWGSNGQGRLGNNSTTSNASPAAVDANGILAGRNVSQVSAGEDHTCAIASNSAYCWGRNNYGQLGNGTTTDSSTPVAVNIPGNVTSIDTGRGYTCAVADGEVYCWGRNSFRQLGNPAISTSGTSTPTAVDTSGVLDGKIVSTVSAGRGHTCALAEGDAYCWGYNGYGQLGNGRPNTYETSPIAVTKTGALAAEAFVSIDAGLGNHTCAIADGKAYCWGLDNHGQLGDGSTNTNIYTPTPVNTGGIGSRAVSTISAGLNHTCAIASGRPFCWGFNNYGQLGLGSNTSDQSVPRFVVNGARAGSGRDFNGITTGFYHTCFTGTNLYSYCWGRNHVGQLGDGTTSSSPQGVPVATIRSLFNVNAITKY